MKECNISNRGIYFFIGIYIFLILLLLVTTPFSYSEADILYSTDFSIESFIVQYISKFSNSVWALRLPFYLFSLLSLFLYVNILKDYFKDSYYYNLSIFIFLITPGVFLSFILVNYATLPILLTLIFIFSYKKSIFTLQIISLVLLFFTHTASFVVYIAIILYTYRRQEYLLMSLSILLLLLSIFASYYRVDGIPKGHLLQLVGIYSAIFSPLMFLAIIFSLYKMAINGKKDILWYISIVAFIISVILSMRQNIKITDFSPYLTMAIPLVVNIFKSSLEVRLSIFRKSYFLVCKVIVLVLLLETLIIILHYPIYKYLPKGDRLIDSSIYKIEESANSNIKRCKNNISRREKSLYRYYGIEECK